MGKLYIRQIWKHSYEAYTSSGCFQSEVQRKTSLAILNCKSGKLGINISQCPDCGHIVFTLPHELNPLFLCNQQLLYHVHMHCIVSGGGLTADHKIRKVTKSFFLPVKVLRDKFKGKFLAGLDSFYKNGSLAFSASCDKLRNSYEWSEFRNLLYGKEWCTYIKETFHGFGNAIEYLGRYTHKIAISNSRILSVDEQQVTFSARGKSPGEPRRIITLKNIEFIRRYLMHVLPPGFQKIRCKTAAFSPNVKDTFLKNYSKIPHPRQANRRAFISIFFPNVIFPKRYGTIV